MRTDKQQAERKARPAKLEQKTKKLRNEMQEHGGEKAGGKGGRYLKMTDEWGNISWVDQWQYGWGTGGGHW